jgi:hypothetical protein
MRFLKKSKGVLVKETVRHSLQTPFMSQIFFFNLKRIKPICDSPLPNPARHKPEFPRNDLLFFIVPLLAYRRQEPHLSARARRARSLKRRLNPPPLHCLRVELQRILDLRSQFKRKHLISWKFFLQMGQGSA